MKLGFRIFNFYLDASIHVGLAVASLLQFTILLFELPSDTHLTFFVFFGSISCYNFIKFGVEVEKYIVVTNQYDKGIQFLSIVALILALYHGFYLSYSVWIGILVLVLFTGLYALPVLPKAKNLRSLSGLKIFVVAIVWAGATVALPIISADQIFNWDIGVELFQRFLLVLILLVPFEIRDLAYDSIDLRTLPQRFGVLLTKVFCSAAILFFMLSTFLKDELEDQEIILKVVLSIALALTLLLTSKNQSKYFASFWVESIPIFLWGLAIIILGN